MLVKDLKAEDLVTWHFARSAEMRLVVSVVPTTVKTHETNELYHGTAVTFMFEDGGKGMLTRWWSINEYLSTTEIEQVYRDGETIYSEPNSATQ